MLCLDPKILILHKLNSCGEIDIFSRVLISLSNDVIVEAEEYLVKTEKILIK